MKNIIAIGLSVVAIVIAGFAFVAPHSPTLGNATQSYWDAKLGYKVNGTTVLNSSGFITGPTTGTCSLIANNYTLAASSSIAMDCAITGILPGDILFGQFATSSANGAGWLITQASASSTAGFGTFRVVNNTGASALIPASVASTTSYFVSR